ncbi:hypothetical protein F3K20_20260 [Streptomyces scabiei]|uniref:hypothetical protein n=1 Tax=Streptomyces scabiei TaxID=1930 RepID=UPI001B31149A|nr:MULTISPECIES: hypothetical protein [Streptomyces]MDX3520370.1 hypothetical protein [Streptomyces scabiei]QTU46864.1 hypothetical protein F3K20_20260 [Streptomyces sp. LBUM 1482]
MSFTASSDAAPAGGEAAESSPQNASALEGSTSKALVLVTDEPAKSAVVDAAEVIASLRQVHSTAAEAVDAATAICRPYADIAAQLAQTMDSVRAVATAPAAVVATASRVSEIAAQLSSTVVLPQPAIVHAAKSATFLTGTVTSVANLAGQMRFPAIDTRTVAVQRSLADFAASVLQPPLIPRAVLETLIPVARTEHLLAQYARSISQPLLDAQARIAAAPWMKLDIAPLISSVQETVAAFGITSRLSAVVRASIEDWEAPFLMRDALKWAAVILDEAKGYRLVRWAKRALTAYATGDSLPLRTFIRNELKLTDRLDERCQALALAILEGLIDAADPSDPAALHKAMRTYASTGVGLERDRTLRGQRIQYLGDFIPQDLAPGPETDVLNRAVAWPDQFDNPHVRYATRQLKPNERDVSRVWAEDSTITWLEAPLLIGAQPEDGIRVRRKLRRLGNEVLRRKALEMGEGQ